MATNSPNVESIFCAAVELATPEECKAYLQDACGGNEDLRQRVENLLQAHFRAGNFLEPTATTFEPAIDEAILEGAGTVIGPYKLLQQIGEGGMGVVFLAEQSRPVQRQVALKIIKPGMDTRQVLARFAAEQQALALMDHPNIARVFDAGTTESGRPYFAMELVKGVPITEYCDQQHLTPQQRLELFVPICHALQHAHQKGIIHRDLKPCNVLVALYDGRPVPKVIDFGVAKATGAKLTERTMFTEIGQVVGTLEYMSPEQAELNQLDVDTRSDIYSLGVLLYELLTGTTPFERKRLKAAAFLELLRMIREEEPPKPSTRLSTTEGLPTIAANRSLEPKKLSGLLRGDLDWIVMKALEKDRSRRYETANALSRDLQRFLADEPVEAAPPSTAQRVRRFVRRNKRTALAAAAVLAALIAGVIGTSLGLLQAQRQRAEAVIARDDAVTARDSAAHEAQRADQQANLAREEAAASKRLVDYVGAQYALSQGRLRDAYQQIEAAINSKPLWEYGRLLAKIVAEARKDWQPAARIFCETVPHWACFVGSGPKWLVVSEGDLIKVHSAVDGQQVGNSKIPGSGSLACAAGADRIAIAMTKGQVDIYALPELRPCGSCQMPDSIVSFRSDANGKHLAILNRKGVVRVFDDTGKQLAEHQFALAQGYYSQPSIDISPLGSAVLFDPGGWTEKRSLWKWETNDVRTFTSAGNILRLRSDDILVGLRNPSSSSVTSELYWQIINESELGSYTFQNILFTSQMRLEGVTTGRGVAGISLVSNDMIKTFPANIAKPGSESGSKSDAPDGQHTIPVSFARYHSLWPQRAEAPKLLAFDAASQSLALGGGREIVIFGNAQTSARRQLSTRIPMDNWSLGMAGGNALFAAKRTLQILNLRLQQTSQVEVEPPPPFPERSFYVWGVTGTPDGRHVAVRWQETSGGVSVAATYFRKMVRVYEFVPSTDKEFQTLKVVGEVDLKELGGIDGQTNKQIVLTPDGNTVACGAKGTFVGYRVDNGAKKYELELGSGSTFSICHDPPLFGAGRYDQPDDFIIWNIQDGKEISRFKLDAPMRTAAFSPDGKLVYIGLTTNLLRSYKVSNGQLVSEISTALTPKAIPPIGTRFLGFLPNGAGSSGSTVLADLDDGHVLEVLNPASYVLDGCYCSDDAGAFVYVIDRYSAEVMRSIAIDEAVQMLDRTSPQLVRQRGAAKYVKLVHVATGRVLAVQHDSADPAARIIVAEDEDNKARQWIFDQDGDDFSVVNRQSGMLLDVYGMLKDDGAAIIQYDEKPVDNDNQIWSWSGNEEGPEKARRLKNKSSGLVLDMDDKGKAIQRRANDQAKTQLWQVIEVPKGDPP
jgi:serine/threonine protein kinase/WD40 repeat protein